ncbi:MAG: signal recognition particle-docking protein FtsY [Candidatus Diapherotrites archaeon]|nr:signal recognition particle-docking protein FtsY [Candidatus Diapherotrites archaeon]
MFDFLKKKLNDFTQRLSQKAGTQQLEAIKIPDPQKPPQEKKKGLKEESPARRLEADVGVAKKVAGALTGSIELTQKELEPFLDELELALLEGDVEQETAQALTKELQMQLAGQKIPSKENVNSFLKEKVRAALEKIMQTRQVNLFDEMERKKPFVILVMGPNGAGKTTTIAKLTHYLQAKGKKAILASADTFRAGSIEQLEVHAQKLNARLVKHRYGADPAAVAFDAVKAANAERADAVLIDCAGRQETNKNLMEELKKIVRVAKPDLKIYVGEAYTGQALLHQAQTLEKEVGIDAFILTKIDTDAKGGTAISLLHQLKKPILFVGTGQGYGDLKPFTPTFILDNILG